MTPPTAETRVRVRIRVRVRVRVGVRVGVRVRIRVGDRSQRVTSHKDTAITASHSK